MFGLFKAPIEWLEKFGVNAGFVLVPLGIVLIFFLFNLIDFSSSRVIGFMVATAPVWLPIITFFLFFEYWMYYVQKHFDLGQGRVSLEVFIPQEVFKSPVAMEAVLTQLWQTASPDNHIQTYWDGKHPPLTGLEIISTGGNVRFILNVTRKKMKNIAEWHLYAQYPGIEIREMPVDYTAEIAWDPAKFQVFSLHFGKKGADHYPIKTYVDYELHTNPKEEEKIDPITTIIELLGSISPGEHIWFQFLIKAHRAEEFQTGSLVSKPDWKPDFEKEIKEITKKARDRGASGEEDEGRGMTPLTDGERDRIKALERSRGKYAFHTYIRVIYAAKEDKYNPSERIGGIITSFFNFNDFNRNQFGLRWRTDFNWNMWQDPSGKKRLAMKKSELSDYKKRSYAPQTVKDIGSILTTEELATIFHFPGQVATTPTLQRVPSKRGEAPSNLPIATS